MSQERDRHDDRNNSKSSRNHEYLIKLCGIPCSSNKDDIKKFLYPCRIDTIYLYNNRGSTSGECLVDLVSETDVKDALKKSKQLMEKKYVESMISWCEPVIRMNGLPYMCTMGDIQIFFKDITIARNGIYISRDMTDNAVGDGYVAFVSMDNAYRAIDMFDQKSIQHRYIQLSPSTYDEAKKTILNDAHLNGKRFAGESDDEDNKNNDQRRSNQNQRRSQFNGRRDLPTTFRRSRSNSSRSRSRRSHNGTRQRSRSRSQLRRSSDTLLKNEEYLVKMRGMPYNVVDNDIREFFPSSCQPVHIKILHDRRTKKPNGDADVYFSTRSQVDEAVKCDRKYMRNRYVEVYSNSRRRVPSDRQRSKSPHSSHHSSHSSSGTRNHEKSRSRSESQNTVK